MVTGLQKGRAVAILWADVPPSGRADLEGWAVKEPLAPIDPATGVLAVGRYVAVSGGPAFLEIHELLGEDAPGVDERAVAHGLPPALQIGRIDIPPAHDDEFNEWYNTEYLIGNMTVNGVYAARRYLNRKAGPRYLTVYEFAHTEVSRQPAWDRTRAQSVWRRRIERFWAHASGSPGIYRRLAAR